MSARPSALVIVTTELVAQPTAIAKLKEELSDYDVHQQLLERLSEHAVVLPANKFSRIHVAGGALTGDVADRLYDTLKDGGTLSGNIREDSRAPLVIAGFVSGSSNDWTKKTATATQSTALPVRRGTGKPHALKNRTLPVFKRVSDAVNKASETQETEGDDELIDEDELVSGDVAPAYNFPAKCDPGPGKKRRRACKDCTCGLKDAEEAEESVLKEKQDTVMLGHDEIAEIDFTVPGKAVGGCGSCALGDAFRCDGCPYLGLPPFRPGEVVSVDQFGDDF